MSLNRNFNSFLVAALALSSLICSASHADTCPTPPTMVAAKVASTVSLDPKTKKYTYSYSVQNLRSSLLSIDRFLVIVPAKGSKSKSPPKWDMDFGAIPPRMDWGTWLPDPKTPDLNKVPDPNNPGPDWLPAFYAIKPGAQLSGFSFESSYPPAPTKYMIAGDTGIPGAPANANNDEPEPNCPGWDWNAPKYESMTVGITQGPADPKVAYVPIRLRGEDAKHPPRPINPNHATGKIGVLILSTRSLDASKIDPASLQFGPGKAKPISSKLIPNRGDRDEHEREDWEKNALFSIANAKKNPKSQNLFVQFDLKSVGTRCILDHALFLTGKTKDGKPIFGGVSIKTVGCHMFGASAKRFHHHEGHHRSDHDRDD